ncbi:cpsf2 [Symbiodinium natans]|uniref:Cleavage and polyadenylation specificity factor subunit 2 n=1 Tax=Symbiodinium natans TaxID=878477 RepID=A0A812QXJ7_9DINO|nr:cpsf2 [Symbiodinium natans]
MDFALLPISKDSLEWQCSILQLGGLTVLLNCGWSESFDPKLLSPLIPHLHELDLIVLTHADFKHLGALPYLLTKYPVSCPVVCTEPVCRLGELACVAALEDREKYREPSDAYEVDDVLRIFMSRLSTLKYRETFRIQVNGRVLAACPFPAGPSLGSAYWTLQCGSLSAVYLVDGTMRKGRYLDGLELERMLPGCRGTAQRWDVVVTSPLSTARLADGSEDRLKLRALPGRGALQKPPEVYASSKAITIARTVREQCFLEETVATLRKGGSVLIPADVAGWIPEALLLFEAAWNQDRQLATYPLVWLSSMGDMVLDQVKTRLEYMGHEVLEAFESRPGHHPFVLKNVRIFQSLEELVAAHPLNRPKVIFATSQHLEAGDARELFFRISGESKALLWLLGVAPQGTLARTLLEDFVLGNCMRKEYRLQYHSKTPFPDEELRAFYEKMQEQAMEPPAPPDVAVAMKAEDILSVQGGVGQGGRAKAEEAEAKVEHKVEVKAEGKVEGKAEAKADAKAEVKAETKPEPKALAKEAAKPSSALWSPLGWPSSRTVAFAEPRAESDSYGQLLSASELRLWRAQDQEGTKYTASGPETASALPSVKEEAVKLEAELAEGESSEWRESLRAHFREPMRCDVRDRLLKVNCKVRYLPDSSLEARDLTNLLQLVSPRHVVVLPARAGSSGDTADTSTGAHLQAHFQKSDVQELSRLPPEIHILRPKDQPLQLSLRSSKRLSESPRALSAALTAPFPWVCEDSESWAWSQVVFLGGLERYEVKGSDVLGIGSFSVVRRGRDVHAGQVVAVKSLKAASSAKFRREVFLFEALYSDGEVDQASPKSRRALSRSATVVEGSREYDSSCAPGASLSPQNLFVQLLAHSDLAVEAGVSWSVLELGDFTLHDLILACGDAARAKKPHCLQNEAQIGRVLLRGTWKYFYFLGTVIPKKQQKTLILIFRYYNS